MSAHTTTELFSSMFAGWDRVSTYQQESLAGRKYHVHLELDAMHLERFREPAQLIDQLWPRPARLARSGVRFHGRTVGRRK